MRLCAKVYFQLKKEIQNGQKKVHLNSTHMVLLGGILF